VTAIHLVHPEAVETGNMEARYMMVQRSGTWADLETADVEYKVFVEALVLLGLGQLDEAGLGSGGQG